MEVSNFENLAILYLSLGGLFGLFQAWRASRRPVDAEPRTHLVRAHLFNAAAAFGYAGLIWFGFGRSAVLTVAVTAGVFALFVLAAREFRHPSVAGAAGKAAAKPSPRKVLLVWAIVFFIPLLLIAFFGR